MEKIDDIRPQIVDTPGKPGMHRRNEIKSYGEQSQHYQA